MAAVIAAIIGSYPLSVPILGVLVAVVSLIRARARRKLSAAIVVDRLLAYYVLFAVGIANLINFVFHVFFGGLAAHFIGWADSPFQTEVGYASLGFSAVGFLAFRGSFDLRLAAVVGPAIFLLGAGIGHIQQVVATQNYAPGNGGFVLYTDFAVPVFGLVLLWLNHIAVRRPPASAAR
jgi:hypothetical protein